MPDRDRFRRLPRYWRRAARSFEALARGEVGEIDQEAVGQGLARDLAGGVQTLAPVLEVFDELNHRPLLYPELACEELARATQGMPRDRTDSVLLETAEKNIMAGQYEPKALLERFVESLLLHNVIDSKGGVAHVLRAEGILVDRAQLVRSAEPTTFAFAEKLLEKPKGKRLLTDLPAHRPVDHDASLLEINSW